jgi:hypothetical protein
MTQKKHSGWRKSGDLGRYRIESDCRPRFETIRANKEEGVVVWYHMAQGPQSIDPDQFRKECVNTWSAARTVGQPVELLRDSLNIKRGMTFTMASDLDTLPWPGTRPRWKYNEKGDWAPVETPPNDAERTRDFLRGRILQVRLVRREYVSCDVLDEGTIVIIPALYLARYGAATKDLWDHLLEDDEDP